MKALKISLIVTVMLAILGGIGYVLSPYGIGIFGGKDDGPQSVAAQFWQAALSPNPSTSSAYRVEQEGLTIGISGQHEEDVAIFGKGTQENNAYFLETTLKLNRSGRLVSVPMQTILIFEGNGWKVDYWSTKQSVFDATLNQALDWYIGSVQGAAEFLTELAPSDKNEIKDKAAALDERLEQEFELARTQLVENYKLQLQTAADYEAAQKAAKQASQNQSPLASK